MLSTLSSTQEGKIQKRNKVLVPDWRKSAFQNPGSEVILFFLCSPLPHLSAPPTILIHPFLTPANLSHHILLLSLKHSSTSHRHVHTTFSLHIDNPSFHSSVLAVVLSPHLSNQFKSSLRPSVRPSIQYLKHLHI